MGSGPENRIAEMLDDAGIVYSRPELDKRDPTNLDFYLPKFGLYVEVKGYHTERLTKQLALVPPNASVLVLIGPQAPANFKAFVIALQRGKAG